MKAEELMIGDWVVGGSGEPFKIGIIDPDFLHWNEVQPIPLTPEILEKNGFEEDDGAYIYYSAHYDDCVNWCGTILKIGSDNGNMEMADVQYVHEMQHALRLCGIKKEIEL